MISGEDIARRALHSLEAGNFAAAKEKAKKALSIDPGQEEAWSVLVSATFAGGDNKNALALAQKWVAVSNASQRALLRIAIISILTGGNKGQARSAIDTFTIRYPNERDVAQFLETLYEVQLGSDSRADVLSKDLLRKYPELADVFVLRAANLYALNRFESAYALIRKAVSMDPQNVGAMRWLAIIAYRTLRYPVALRVSKRGQSLAPDRRVFPTLRFLSIVSWFPPIFLSQLLYRLIFGASGLLRGPDWLRQLATLIIAIIVTRFALAPIFGALIDLLASAGMQSLFIPIVILFLLFTVTPEIMISRTDRSPTIKSKPVKLKDY